MALLTRTGGAVVVAVLLAGCTATTDSSPSESAPSTVRAPEESDSPASPEASVAAEPTQSATPSGQLRAGERVEVSLAHMFEPRELVLNGSGAGVVEDWGPGAPLVWFDLDSGDARVVAQPDPRWTIDMVSTSDEWLVWVEQDDLERDDPFRDVSWRVWAYEFASDETTLVREAQERTPLVPGVSVFGSLLFFDVYRGLEARSSDIFVAVLDTGEIEIVAEAVAGASPTWDGERLLLAVTESVTGPGQAKDDIYVVEDGELTAVTDTDRSMGPQYSDGHLLWREPTENADGTVGPDQIWVRSWPGDGGASLVEERQSSAASLGRGFVVDWSFGEQTVTRPLAPVVIPIAEPHAPVELENPTGTELFVRPEAFGTKIAWVASKIGAEQPGEGSVLVVQTIELQSG